MEKQLSQEQTSEQDSGTGRLEAFSDGVFAIAITLLVLDLKVPDLNGASPAALGATLLKQWPNYLTLFISFATILIMWVYHHRLFQTARRTETLLLFSNGFLLLLVTVVPFPTALVAAYLTTPSASLVCALYSGFFVFIDLAYNLLIWVVSRQQPLKELDHCATRPALLCNWRAGGVLESLCHAGHLLRAVDCLGLNGTTAACNASMKVH